MKQSRPATLFLRRLRRLARDDRAATAIEYGLIACLIVVAMIASLQGLANVTVGIWNNINSQVGNATGH